MVGQWVLSEFGPSVSFGDMTQQYVNRIKFVDSSLWAPTRLMTQRVGGLEFTFEVNANSIKQFDSMSIQFEFNSWNPIQVQFEFSLWLQIERWISISMSRRCSSSLTRIQLSIHCSRFERLVGLYSWPPERFPDLIASSYESKFRSVTCLNSKPKFENKEFGPKPDEFPIDRKPNS